MSTGAARKVFVSLIIITGVTIATWTVVSSTMQPLLILSSVFLPNGTSERSGFSQKIKTYFVKQPFLLSENVSELHHAQHSTDYRSNRSLPFYYKQSTHPNERFRQKYSLDFTYTANLPKQDSNKSKLILFYNIPSWYGRAGSEFYRGIQMCPIKTCQFSRDSKKLSQADAVIIDGVELGKRYPPHKAPNQVWIFFGLESPNYYYSSLYKSKQWRDVFNWTMTYRLDSDVPIPYDMLRRREPSMKNFTHLALQKNKSAVWFVGNCHTPGKREMYVRELRKFYDVDIFGRCGKPSPPTKLFALPKFVNKYRFYLAFENGLCFDYITEKLFKTYSDDLTIVPVVRGGANYGSVAPNGTYINAADFSSPEKLAAYLKYLERNVTAYADVLQRKDEFINEGNHTTHESGFCDICMKLHNLDVASNHYSDIGKWISNDICRRPTDLMRNVV